MESPCTEPWLVVPWSRSVYQRDESGGGQRRGSLARKHYILRDTLFFTEVRYPPLPLFLAITLKQSYCVVWFNDDLILYHSLVSNSNFLWLALCRDQAQRVNFSGATSRVIRIRTFVIAIVISILGAFRG